MIKYLYLGFLCFALSCKGQSSTEYVVHHSDHELLGNEDSLEMVRYFAANQGSKERSVSLGTVANGSLKNGKLVPPFGSNFRYFDKDSYVSGRAFLNEDVLRIVLAAYSEMEQDLPARTFLLMECSNKEGGEIYPHRTHRNGLSVDFMMPKLKNKTVYTDLDTLGKDHYFLNFDDQGRWDADTTVQVDFETIARHLLILNEEAKEQGYRISKVIIKLEYKDELFGGVYGQQLKQSGIYFARNLTPLINAIHDDHYHVDFEKP